MRIRLVKWKIYGKAMLLFIFIVLLICCTASCAAEKQESEKQELPKQEFLEKSGEQLKKGSIPIYFFIIRHVGTVMEQRSSMKLLKNRFQHIRMSVHMNCWSIMCLKQAEKKNGMLWQRNTS